MGAIVPDASNAPGVNRRMPCSTTSRARTRERGLPLVDAEVGALLRVLATAVGATRLLEIGTAVGYSGIWLAGALPPGGMLLTMEISAERAQEARENFARAGLTDRVSVIVGDAQLKLAKVAGPFDLIFQDGDKQLYRRCSIAGRPAPAGRAARHRQRVVGRRSRAGISSNPHHNPDDTRAIVDTTSAWPLTRNC